MLSKYLFAITGAWWVMRIAVGDAASPGWQFWALWSGVGGGLLGLAVHRVRHRIWEAVEIALTLAWWTLRSRGRALVSILRGKPDLAAVQGEGLR